MSCEIYTLSLTGRKRTVCVNSEEEMKNMTLKEFLRRFCPEEEEQLYRCRYIFDGKQLEGDQTLGYYGIKNGSTVHTVLLLRGGALTGPDGGEDEDGDGGEDEDEDEDGDRDRDRDRDEGEDEDGDRDGDGDEDGDRDRDEDEDEDEDGDRDEDEDEGMSRTESMDSLDDMQQTEPECCIL